MTKMTYVDALNTAIEILGEFSQTDETTGNVVEEYPEVIEKLTALKEQVAKKRTSSNSKASAETAARTEKVYEALGKMEKPVTITEFLKLTDDEEVAEYSNQRVSALLRKLGDRVTKEIVKGKAYFAVA